MLIDILVDRKANINGIRVVVYVFLVENVYFLCDLIFFYKKKSRCLFHERRDREKKKRLHAYTFFSSLDRFVVVQLFIFISYQIMRIFVLYFHFIFSEASAASTIIVVGMKRVWKELEKIDSIFIGCRYFYVLCTKQTITICTMRTAYIPDVRVTNIL